MLHKIAFYILGILLLSSCDRKTTQENTQEQREETIASVATRWPEEKANNWYKDKGWLIGSNFSPSTAINQLEMWQAESFDTITIDRELGWAQDLGFNSMRVFLHDKLWEQDSAGFLQRLDKYLSIADRHNIGTMFVLFDGVWYPFPKLGKQRAPKPHVHNSGWLQSPGVEILKDTTKHNQLQGYVKGVLRRFANDKRIDAWDLFNEPDNINRPAYVQHEPENKADLSMALLAKTFQWAREINPSQPLTVGVWAGNWSDTSAIKPLDSLMLASSDVISFHNYDSTQVLEQKIKQLQRFNRPILCTEYMARGNNSTFKSSLPTLQKYNVGAYNWGFVAGKTQTIYPWDSWTKTYTAEPKLWFHDIFRKDGKPYRRDEVALIKQLTGAKKAQ